MGRVTVPVKVIVTFGAVLILSDCISFCPSKHLQSSSRHSIRLWNKTKQTRYREWCGTQKVYPSQNMA